MKTHLTAWIYPSPRVNLIYPLHLLDICPHCRHFADLERLTGAVAFCSVVTRCTRNGQDKFVSVGIEVRATCSVVKNASSRVRPLTYSYLVNR